MSAETPSTEGPGLHGDPSRPAPSPEGLSSLLARVVPSLADWCALDLLDDEGGLVRQVVVAEDPSKAALAVALQREGRLDLNARHGPARAFRTSTSQLLSLLEPADEAALGPVDLVRALGTRCCLAVPLPGHHGPLGVLTLARGEERPLFTEGELHEVEELCRGWMEDGADDPAGLSCQMQEILDQTRRLQELEKQRLMAELKQEQRLLEDLVQQMPVGVVVRDLSGDLILANDRVTHLLGRRAPQNSHQLTFLRIDGQPLPFEELPTSRVARTGEVVAEQILAVDRPDGERAILRASSAPVRDAQGHMFAIMVTCQDITEQKKTDEALLQTVRRFRSLMEASTAIVWIVDARGELVEDSPSWMAFTGQSAQEHRGWGWLNAIHPDDRGRVLTAWRRARETQEPFEVEYRMRRKDGTFAYTSVRGAPVLSGDGTVREWIGTNSDVTARREAEEALRQETEIAEALNRTAECLAAELDFDRLANLLTAEAARLTGAECCAFFKAQMDRGQPREGLYSLTGVPLEAFHGLPMPRGTRILDPALSNRTVLRVDDVTRHPEYGKNPPYHGMPEGHAPVKSYLAAEVATHNEEVQGVLLLGHTEPGRFTLKHERLLTGLATQAAITLENAWLYERACEAEERAHRAARLGEEFMGILGHDLRTPLQAISLSANLLLKRGDLPEAQVRSVARIATNADRMGRLVADLLDVTRARLGEGMPVNPQPTNLYELCHRVVEEFEAAWPRRTLTLELHGDGTGEWDPDRMSQVLTNLLDNAMKYSPEGERITLRSRDDARGLELEVHNGGKPIPPELLPTLFEPFRRGKKDDAAARSSLGLGLYIVREILKAHGGTIDVRSSTEEGTTFSIRLPRHRP